MSKRFFGLKKEHLPKTLLLTLVLLAVAFELFFGDREAVTAFSDQAPKSGDGSLFGLASSLL